MIDFHFIRPYFLLLLLPLLFWKFIVVVASNKINIWKKAIDSDLLSELFASNYKKNQSLNYKIVIAIWVLLVISISGPAWHETPQAMYKNIVPTTIILDGSISMDATDVEPTRMFRSILKIYDILEKYSNNLFSLIIYSDEPYVIVPLTDDVNVVKNYLPLMSSKILPSQGSRLDRAIDLATYEMKKSGLRAGHIIVFTDSPSHDEDYDHVLDAAQDAASSGYIVSVFGVGTIQGATIETRLGELAVSVLDEKKLIKLVAAGEGRYHKLSQSSIDIDFVFANINERIREQNPLVKANIESAMWQDEGFWFVIPAVFLFPFLFRKGVIVVIVVGVFTAVPSFAFDYREYFLSPEQYGSLLLKEGKSSQAEIYLTKNPQLLAIAWINQKRDNNLLKLIQEQDSFENLYNIGTIAAKKERYEIALTALAKAVKINPESYDAAMNYAVVKKILEQEAPNDGGDKSGQKGKKDAENQDNNSDSNSEDNSQSESQSLPQDQQQAGSISNITEPVEDTAELLRNKIKRLYDMRRYGYGGEVNPW